MPGTWAAGFPADTSLRLQVWIADAAGPQGFSASTALKSTSP